jgi:Mlc titration factor MtfA (ptsG expression regulator)
MIQNDARIKNKLITSDYFRKYAFENHYEFIAVLIESFIETPEEFKSEFPKIYNKIKTMLNFNFLHY